MAMNTKKLIPLLLVLYIIVGLVGNGVSCGTKYNLAEQRQSMYTSGSDTAISGASWTINKTEIIENEVRVINEMIIIEAGGELIIENSTIFINSSINRILGIEVYSGGNLTIRDSRITAYNSKFRYYIWARHGAKLYISGSEISYAGIEQEGKRGVRIDTENVTIEDSHIYNNFIGLVLNSANNVLIVNNNITANTMDGILVFNSTNITIKRNNIAGNGFGLRLIISKDVVVYLNNFIDNSVYDDSSNKFDNGTYGNYWSGYKGKDSKPRDWIYDSGCVIPNSSIDNKPLVYPKDVYLFPDADFDGDGLTNGEEKGVGTDPYNIDTDSDGLNDSAEVHIHYTNATNPDTDGDNMPDGWEVQYDLNPSDPSDAHTDTDGDGLQNVYEYGNHTDPLDTDTDGDGLNDSAEVQMYHTDPLDTDTDGDGLDDYWEASYGFDATNSDTASADPDNDGLKNSEEYRHGTNPLSSDTDGDGLSDYAEVVTYHTDPLSTDTDGDGLDDSSEINTYKTDPSDADSDDDGLEDGWEVEHNMNPLDVDSDGDGLSDYDEVYIYHLDPLDSDTDDDGMDDGWEIYYGLNPTLDDSDADVDFDGLTNKEEYSIGTDPTKYDSDGDGFSDYMEYTYGFDPLDPTSHPRPDILRPVKIMAIVVAVGVITALVFLRRRFLVSKQTT